MRFFIILFLFMHSSLFSSQHIVEQKEFEAFQYSCVEEQSQKVCDLKGFVFDSSTQEIVSFMSFNVNLDGLTQLQIALPHAVNLKSAVILQIDDNDPFELDYTFCNPTACYLAEIVADNFINSLKSGNQLTLKVLLLDNREATINYSLVGFTAGYNYLLESVLN